jgi:glucose/arabinose dehydrogenase
MRRIASALVCGVLLAGAPGAASAQRAEDRSDPLPRFPPGFAVSVYARLDGIATSLAFGPDGTLYVTDFARGRILSLVDAGGVAGAPTEFASGFSSPLGVVVDKDGTVFVADAEGARKGPYGTRPYGRVWRVTDKGNEIVVKDLPNGRHNTNGMAFGPDGRLYITNGNSTDDGVEGGNPETPLSGSVVRVDPEATKVSAAALPKSDVVAGGMRNVYDLAFSPYDKDELFVPMNGADDARKGEDGSNPTEPIEDSDDLLYVTDVASRGSDDFGFPSCLYNVAKKGSLKPYDNPNPDTMKQFGKCPIKTVPRPVASFGLHVSANGLAFQTTDAWGKEYRNDLFVTEFGNFFGPEVTGHRIVHLEFDKRGRKVTRQVEFLTGITPLDVVFDKQGAMYVADFTGTIFKVVRLAEVPNQIDVQMNGLQFLPQALVIPEGTTVRWTNQDAVTGFVHNVRAQLAVRADGSQDEGKEMNSPDALARGESHSFRFDTPGKWIYTCTVNVLHTAAMHGSITVVPAGS